MVEDSALIEERIAKQRHELGATFDAIAYQADLKKRLPEYAQEMAGAVSSAARTTAASLAERAAHRVDELATEAASASVATATLARGAYDRAVPSAFRSNAFAPYAVVPVALGAVLAVFRLRRR